MDKPELHLQVLLEKLIKSSLSFALYRLPWTDEPILVLQQEGEAEQIDSLSGLNNKKGFVFAPFRPSATHPVLLIKGDFICTGWNQMMETLSTFFQLHQELGKDESLTDAVENANSEADTGRPISDTSKRIEQSSRTVSEEIRKQQYTEAFNSFITPLKEKEFEKLVLSRCASYPLAETFSSIYAFVSACNNYPRMMISLTHTPSSGIWIGSTPEIILSGQHTDWHTVALAGTMPMDGENMPTEWSAKNQKEQLIVSEYIQQVLKNFKTKAELRGPYTARAGHLVHLKTDFLFSLKHTDHLGDLLDALHPTPAVCGLPKEKAYQFILAHEGYNRSYYSGIIGWLDPEDITNLYVNLRCMHITEKETTLYAGGGILPSSNVDAEWEETQIKMNTMRKCLE